MKTFDQFVAEQDELAEKLSKEMKDNQFKKENDDKDEDEDEGKEKMKEGMDKKAFIEMYKAKMKTEKCDYDEDEMEEAYIKEMKRKK
jgi:hypothetical protein|tara:strand:+ start:313 stop:573 length:261 start_codon:yes stop_codon:yes gene_type:complete